MPRSIVAIAAGGFPIARRDAVPDTPDIFPALPALAVKESILQIVGLARDSSDRRC